MRGRASFGLLACSLIVATAAADPLEPEVLDDLYRPWHFRIPSLSPDGKFIAAEVFENATLRARVIDRATGASADVVELKLQMTSSFSWVDSSVLAVVEAAHLPHPQLEEEFQALGVPWKRRGARNDEYVAAMRALWAGPHAEFHGEFVDFEPVTCSPRPVNASIPILVGGDTPAAIRRAARLADGYFPGTSDVKLLGDRIAQLGIEASKQGRSADDIQVHAIFGQQMADPAAGVEQMAKLGVQRLMVPAFFFMGPGGLDRLSEFGERVVRGAA